eukprot:TRINITY_DN3631_c0_g1_i1.p1 TRINITY_DN3631_c0_g1~~TRINITY_DN3631_c0_g1_i1.p1  ORF type:complete len:441 (+),score=89.07 TRINITY_DN3631_c0_g1_i1:611-1933(+)
MVKQIGPYVLGHTLGQGSFGEVKIADDKRGAQAVAVKICAKQLLAKGKGRPMLQREIATMKQLQHPNVLRLIDVMETGKHFYLVIELATGGELLDQITNERRFKEDTARKYFRQLIMGVQYCHQRGIVHRDLKPQNLLLTSKNELKIADFGFSNFQNYDEEGKVTPMMRLQTCCGTPNYAAPEVFLGRGYNGFRTDVWSCGVILYVMLTGRVPFRAEGEVQGVQGIILAITEGRYKMPSSLSDPVKDLISRILNINPEERIAIEGIIAHEWFAEGFDYSTILPCPGKLQISEDQIRQSIIVSNEEEVGGGAPVEVSKWGTQTDGVVQREPLSPLQPVITTSMENLSEEVLEVIPTFKDTKYDEHGKPVSKFSASAPSTEKKTTHAFGKAFLPGMCFYCGKFVYGNGMQCKKCKCPVHAKCVGSASEYSWCEQYQGREKEH